jgi:hypothetical protein
VLFFTYCEWKVGNVNVCLLHTSQFMLTLSSVSNVRNYFNVWSGSITFSLPSIKLVCL